MNRIRSVPCRACGDEVAQFLDLGLQPLPDAFRRSVDATDEFWIQLSAVVCRGGLVVLLAQPGSVEQMFHCEYPFRASSSVRMSSHFAATAIRHLGIDPAENLVREALAKKVNARAEWFDATTAEKIRDEHGPAAAVYPVTCCASARSTRSTTSTSPCSRPPRSLASPRRPTASAGARRIGSACRTVVAERQSVLP